MSIPGQTLSIPLIERLRKTAAELNDYSDKAEVLRRIKSIYDIKIDPNTDPGCLKILDESLKRLPPELIRDCGIKIMGFDDLGPSKEYFPNHGKYMDGTLVLNSRLIEDPLLLVDFESGGSLNKFDQTLYHELGHGWDEKQDQGGTLGQLSLEVEWLGLSGWSKEPQPGLKRIIIRDEGTPEIKGEYYYSPDAQFTRFYAKRSPCEDWADTFSYYVGGLKSFLPDNKVKYFDGKLSRYSTGATS